MRYVSDDGKVFDTERECDEYEQHIKSERNKREQLERERQERLEVINRKYKELQNLISEYERDYGIRQKAYFAPVCELMNMLCR